MKNSVKILIDVLKNESEEIRNDASYSSKYIDDKLDLLQSIEKYAKIMQDENKEIDKEFEKIIFELHDALVDNVISLISRKKVHNDLVDIVHKEIKKATPIYSNPLIKNKADSKVININMNSIY